MITQYENKMVAPHKCILDGTLGGAGQGDVGDPRTWLPELWSRLLEMIRPATVLDVGCGFGYSTRWFEQAGCSVLGVDGSKICVDEAVTPAVKQHDFTGGKIRGERLEYDLGWTSEFLEHVDQQYEENIFDALTRCRHVCMTAAPPGFLGHHHVNLQTSEYWIGRFEEHGFRYDADETARLRELARESNPGCYFKDVGLFFIRERIVESRPVWTDIAGWLEPSQGEILQAAARDRRVLELGTFCGRSAVCMARTAKSVTTIDHHRGDESTAGRERWPWNGRDTLAEFTANVERHGHQDRIEPIVADFADVEAILEGRRFDLVFVDGAHDAASVERDTVIALHALAPGGAVVWHDWDLPSVKEGAMATGIPEESLKEMDRLGVFVSARYKVAITIPHSGHAQVAALKSGIWAAESRVADQVMFIDYACGCLTHNFNDLLAHCMNLRDKGLVTHMAMLHSDIAADKGWVDILAEEMCAKRVAVISAVVAIKDPDDDRTSTAIGVRGQDWEYGGYVRLRQEPTMPRTFTAKDVCKDNEVLLINTGCMLIDLSWPFWDDCDGAGTPFSFKVYNRIQRTPEGHRWAQFNPEDWLMSRALDAANIPYAATWKVKTRHIGTKEWDNRGQMLTPAAAAPGVNGHSNG